MPHYLLPLSTHCSCSVSLNMSLTQRIFNGYTLWKDQLFTFSYSLDTGTPCRPLVPCMGHWVPDKWWGEYRAAAQLCPPQIPYKLTTGLNADLRDHSRQLNHLIPGTTFQALLRHSSYYFASSAVPLCTDFQGVCPQRQIASTDDLARWMHQATSYV